tara:strand:- start:413 stop:613 length:201 start_codon:yes stop_codon:yes gene_type:complete
MDIRSISLPLPSEEYDANDEAVTRRSIEQAIEDISFKIKRLEELKTTVASNSFKRHSFLLMGAKDG